MRFCCRAYEYWHGMAGTAMRYRPEHKVEIYPNWDNQPRQAFSGSD